MKMWHWCFVAVVAGWLPTTWASDDDRYKSPFTGVVVSKAKLLRFKGMTAEAIIADLEREGIRFVYLNLPKDDPRNREWKEEELAAFRDYYQRSFLQLKTNSERAHKALGAKPTEGTLRAFHLAPYSHYPKEIAGKIIWASLPRHESPKIVFWLIDGKLPLADTVLHEYTHHLFENASGAKLVDVGFDKYTPTDVVATWAEHWRRKYETEAEIFNAGNFADEKSKTEAFSRVAVAFLERGHWNLQLELLNYVDEAQAYDFQIAVHDAMGVDEKSAFTYLYGILAHANSLRAQEREFRTDPNMMTVKAFRAKAETQIAPPFAEASKVGISVQKAWKDFATYCARGDIKRFEKYLNVQPTDPTSSPPTQ
jgi:hypothetical protein